MKNVFLSDQSLNTSYMWRSISSCKSEKFSAIMRLNRFSMLLVCISVAVPHRLSLVSWSEFLKFVVMVHYSYFPLLLYGYKNFFTCFQFLVFFLLIDKLLGWCFYGGYINDLFISSISINYILFHRISLC